MCKEVVSTVKLSVEFSYELHSQFFVSTFIILILCINKGAYRKIYMSQEVGLI